MPNLLDVIYKTVKRESEGLDALYEDYIVKLIGVEGLDTLKKHNLVEGCGVVNGRRLYALCDRKEK